MNNGSCTVDIHEGVEKLDPNISQPDSWAENSHQNILDSQGIISLEKSVKLIFVVSIWV